MAKKNTAGRTYKILKPSKSTTVNTEKGYNIFL